MKTAKRLSYFLFLLVMCWTNAVGTGWARERELFVEAAWAWVEKGEVRIQAQLSTSPERIELEIAQDGENKSRTFRNDSRISAAVQPTGDSPLLISLREPDEDEPLVSWQLDLAGRDMTYAEKLTVKKASWGRRAEVNAELLALTTLFEQRQGQTTSQADEVEAVSHNEDESGIDESDSNDADQTLDELAQEFYADFAASGKPEEIELRSREVIFELEPNDTFGKADWLFDGKDARGKIGAAGDVDYWKIKGTKHGRMNVSLREIPYGQDYQLYVFDAEQDELGRSERPEESDESVEGIGLEKDQWYYIAVKGQRESHHKDFYYRLRADFLADQSDAKADGYEPNNTLQEAHELPADFSASLTGNLHANTDVDYYRYSFSLTSTFMVDLKDIPAGMDMDLYVQDEQGKVLAKSEKPKNANEQIIMNVNPGSYIIKVMASKRSGFTPNSYKLNVAAKTIPVILIPGIGGSRLVAEENGKASEIWLGLGDSLLGINDPKHRRLLSLEPTRPNSVEVRPRETGVTIYPERDDEGFSAIEYLSYSPLDPVRNMTEQYYSMVKELERMGYKKHRTIFAMPYDWRYSSTKNATELKKKIDLSLERSGARQVHLVAHSMGGLLTRETLLANVSYQPKINRIVYMGTPFLGSPRAYQAIKYGYNFSIPWMDEETGKIISEYAPAVYELLPSKKYFETAGFLRKNRNDTYSYTEFLQDKKIRLDYAPLVKQGGSLHEKWDKKTINVPQYSIVGTGQTTFLGYFFDAYHNEWVPYYDQGLGDGTVPYISANYAQKDIKKRYYVTGEHAKLPTIPEVMKQVTQLLKGIEETQPGLRNQVPGKSAKYLYYIISKEDGTFPELTFHKNGSIITLAADEKEVRDDLAIEYHGNIVVIHVLDQEELEFETPPPQQDENSPKFIIKRFSSEDSRDDEEHGKRYRLDEHGLSQEKHSVD
ncbi:lipase/acyltransferase domain-containing protein [Brevibacillus agri]|uniref:lipase/acyltransferase domain-containing protein n=1 Tax=Brevibacillus agri TaxID=51101 RepID=UPI00287094A3|nr:esterase [Brevibacillus agri]MDR9504561.1 esterase [Brevibacillus agri]